MMEFKMRSIGYVRTESDVVPRHWSVSDITGRLVIDKKYIEAMTDIKIGESIVVLFCFHESPSFTTDKLKQTPPARDRPQGVFSICSPIRPNPIGLSVLEVIRIEDNIILVKGIDMLDGTPILDIKPHIAEKRDCPSYCE